MAYRKQFGGKSGGGLSPATRITQEIIARLEAGTKPWIQPWRGAPVSRPLRACGIPYRGMNVFWLWMVADMCGYPPMSLRTSELCCRNFGPLNQNPMSLPGHLSTSSRSSGMPGHTV